MAGSAGLLFEIADYVSASRMNQKSLFVGTGAQIAALTEHYPGMKAFCTTSSTSGIGFHAGRNYRRNEADSAWENDDSPTDLPYYPLSTTIGDYSTPTTSTMSSVGLASIDSAHTNQTGQDSGGTIKSTSEKTGQVFSASNTELGRAQTKFIFKLSKTGSPTTTITCEILDSSNTLKATMGTYASSSLTGSMAAISFENLSNTYILQSGDRVILRGSGGTIDASNYINVGSYSGGGIANGEHQYYNGSWNQYSAGYDLYLVIDSRVVYPETNLIDNSTSTRGTTTSEANPYQRVGMGSDNYLVGVAIYFDGTNTTETEIKIQYSTNAAPTTYTDLRKITVSNLTSGAWNYILIPAAYGQYIRIYGNSGSSKVLSNYEIKVRTVTAAQFNVGHKHKKISTTDTGIALAA